VFDRDDRRRLLAIARRALEARVRREYEPALETQRGALDIQCGAFVSIHCERELRGCLGRLGDDWPIARVVAHLGRAVADSDPRFAPVTIEDLETLSIEVSALSPEREVHSVQDIEIGRHGLIIERRHRRGLLLPQVATEHGWNVETFLEHTCLKAGLPPDAWTHDARILIFEAEVFGEDSSMIRDR